MKRQLVASASAAVPDVAIVTGFSLALGGIYLLLGLAVALIVAGLVVATAGWLASGAERGRQR